MSFPNDSVVKNCLPWRRHRIDRFDPWVRKIPWKRAWLHTPVFLPGESMDRGTWWAATHRVAKSQTWLKRLNTCTHTRYSFVTQFEDRKHDAFSFAHISQTNFWPFVPDTSLLLYWNTTDFCIWNLYPETLLNLFISSNSSLAEFIGFLYIVSCHL